MRRTLTSLIVVIALVILAGLAQGDKLLGAYPCRAWVVMDWETGQALSRHSAYRELPPASLTKIMTALVALEAGVPEGPFQIPADCTTRQQVTLGLLPGEIVKPDDLLRASLIISANDAAMGLATAVAGSKPAFVDRMNAKATALGLTHTHFLNPVGLHQQGHYSCAMDLASLSRIALRNEQFRALVKQKSFTMNLRGASKTWKSRNELLFQYQFADGIKTGYVSAGGECLAASATKDGWRLITVLLGCPDRAKVAKATFEHFFRTWRRWELVSAGQRIATVELERATVQRLPVKAARPIRYIGLATSAPEYTLSYEPALLTAPVKKGAVVGVVKAVAPDGQLLGQSPLVAELEVELVWWAKLIAVWPFLLAGLLIVAGVLLVGYVKAAKSAATGGDRESQASRDPDNRRPRRGKRPGSH
jgi:D-alanyl-D-alanine carboxypeptidase (penicillin-binding protein 5/6)